MSDLLVTDLHKSFGTHSVLSGLHLQAQAGSFTAILGPSGSGKTTLLRLLAGFEAPDHGTVKIGGRVVDGGDEHVDPEHREIGYVPQEGGLFPHLTVAANVAFGLPRKMRRRGADGLLEPGWPRRSGKALPAPALRRPTAARSACQGAGRGAGDSAAG